MCRHLATRFVLDALKDDKGKVGMSSYGSSEKLAAHLEPNLQKTYDILREQATEVEIGDNRDFGSFLVGQFSKMQEHGTRVILLESDDHATGVRLRTKEKDGGLLYVVSFYDPNDSNMQVRLEVRDLAQLHNLTLQKLIDGNGCTPSLYKEYFPGDEQFLAFVCQPPGDEPKDAPLGGRALTSSTRQLETPTALGMLMRAGFSAIKLGGHDDQPLVEAIKPKLAQMTPTQRADLLAATTGDGSSGLYLALQNGHPDAIKAWGDLLIEADLTKKQVAKLLQAKKAADGTPGLFMALQNGRANAIKAYGDLLIQLFQADCLTKEQLAELLQAKAADGTPGLFMALGDGHARAIETYGDLLIQLFQADRLTKEQVAKLLQAKDADGTPGLFMALQNGHANAIKVYGDLLIQLFQADCLTKEQLAKLLQAKDDDGTPGLFMALQQGHAKAIEAYGDLLIQLFRADCLAKEQVAKLLQAKDAGTPGLFMALEDGHAKAIEAYGDLLIQLFQAGCLMEEQVAELLQAERADGITGLFMAQKNGHAEAIEAIFELLRRA